MDLQSLQIDRKKAAPTRRGRRGPWPFRIGLVVVVAVAGWLFWPSLSDFSDRVRLPVVKTAVVRTAAPAAVAAVRGTAANGYVVAARRAALSSDVPGRIVELRVTEGSVVKQGDIVARLFSDEYRAAVERARADLAVAAAGVARAASSKAAAAAEHDQLTAGVATQQGNVDEQKAQVTWAEQEHARQQELVDQRIGSKRDLDRAKNDLDSATARLQSTTAALRAATAAAATAAARVEVADKDKLLAEAQQAAAAATLQQAQATLDKTDVRAPFDGVVVLKDAEIGEVVSPNVVGGSNARGAVCTMVDFASLEVQANVPETTLGIVAVGAPAAVFLDAAPDQRLRGRVDRIWPTADRQKATVEVRVKLLDRPEILRPEMGVRVVFSDGDAPVGDAAATTGDATASVLLVPESAVVELNGKSGVFVVERDTVRFCEVRIAERKNGRAAIEQGLRTGQTVVETPPPALADGDRVRIATN